MSPVPTKVLSLRIPEELAEEVRAVAYANRVSVSRRFGSQSKAT